MSEPLPTPCQQPSRTMGFSICAGVVPMWVGLGIAMSLGWITFRSRPFPSQLPVSSSGPEPSSGSSVADARPEAQSKPHHDLENGGEFSAVFAYRGRESSKASSHPVFPLAEWPWRLDGDRYNHRQEAGPAFFAPSVLKASLPPSDRTPSSPLGTKNCGSIWSLNLRD